MCVFPFILNISLLFFKRLKLRIFSEFRSRASFSSSYSSSTSSSSPSSDTRLFFVIFIVFFGIKALHYFFAGCYNFNSFLFSLAFSHNYAKHARALSHRFTLFWVCVFVCFEVYVCEWVCKTMTNVIAYVCVYLFTWFIISFRS